MKFFKSIFLLGLLSVAVVSCEDDDEVFTGSPVGNMNIVTLHGQISTPAQSALSNQKIDFTVTLPRTFSDTVAVEATAIGDRGRRFRVSVDVMPGDTTATEEITCPGGSLFDTTFDLFISGIALQTVEPGTHYLIDSNVIQLPTGNTGVPVQDPNALTVRLVWPNASSTVNTLQLAIDRPASITDIANATFNAGGRLYKIRTGATGSASQGASSETGDYVFSIKPSGITATMDIPYRFIVVYPNGDAVVYSGTYVGATSTSPAISLAKITKSYDAGNQAVFAVENLNP